MRRRLTIGYDATAAVNQSGGIGRYARELLSALVEVANDDRFRLLVTARTDQFGLPQLRDRADVKRVPASDRVMNAVWHRLRAPIPVEVLTGRLSVFHSPDFTVPPSLCPSIVTVHDLAFEVVPQLGVASLTTYLQRAVRRSVGRAQAVITPSESTKRDLVRRFGTDGAKIHVIPEGVSGGVGLGEGATARLTRLGVREPFIVAVGTIEPRKNLERLMEAFSQLRPRHTDLQLVIAGRRGWMFDSVLGKPGELGLDDSVIFIEDGSDDDIGALYGMAACVVYASLYEGFGLPALEALAAGAVLACSGTSSLPEVVGSAAAIFDPWDTADMAATIELALTDEELRNRLREAGPKQAATFTWERAAHATSELYHQVAG